jgi:hypothetical protein
VPLDPFHAEILGVAAELPEAREIALAGGGAMLAHGLVVRLTTDVDLFTPDSEEVGRLGTALAVALEGRGYEVHSERQTPTFVRLRIVRPGGDATAVEIALDFRLRPRVQLDVGPVLHPDELAADKVLALFGRAAARDLVDVHALAGRYDSETLLALAAEKDLGFDRAVFAQALLAAAGRADTAFADAGMDADTASKLREWARSFSDRLRR